MARRREGVAETSEAESSLTAAMGSGSMGSRARFARRGLDQCPEGDPATRVLLMRQLYLAHFEGRRFTEALAVAREATKLGELTDVCRQDAARACLALGDIPGALAELRLASRIAPPSRRAFHLWSLGSLLLLSGRPVEAVAVLERAARWGTADKPLFRAQQLLARMASGEVAAPRALRAAYERLASAACGHGYGEFVLGELAYHLGEDDIAAELLGGFVERVGSGRVALAVGLGAELHRAEELLGHLMRRRPCP